MCGRYTSTTPPADLAAYFGVDEVVAPDLGARYNVAPTEEVYGVARSSSGPTRLGTFRWGFVPFWAKVASVGSRMINARAETLVDKPAFRRAFERYRCIIPADGFYEWEPKDQGHTPHWVYRADGFPMAFAGVWASWKDPDTDEWVKTCSILTRASAGGIRPLHDRMPVVLVPEVWDAWLDRDLTDANEAERLLQPIDPDLIHEHPVSSEVNSVRNNHVRLTEPAAQGRLL